MDTIDTMAILAEKLMDLARKTQQTREALLQIKQEMHEIKEKINASTH